ncbi:MAG: PAS domain S-box protein [Desulfobacterales bacterium]|nr:PAS domain S-box protein [Desulfobacterales bacterium]
MENARLCIVEDNRIVAEDIRQTLEDIGYEVTGIATSGEKALKLAEETRPDLALMDINLGKGMDGVEVAGLFRERYNIPVVYLTAHADNTTLDRAKKTQPFGYLIKPFDRQEIQSTLEIALYKCRMDKKLQKSEQWLATTLRCIGDGVIATDAGGRIRYLNPVAEALTGWRSDQALGHSLEEVFRIINEKTRQPCENPVTRVLATGERINLADNTLLVNRHGQEIPIKDSGSPIVLDSGETIGVVLVFQDDTRNKAAAMAVRESETRYRTFVDNFQGIAFRSFGKTAVEFITGNVKTITGYDKTDFRNERVNYYDLIHPEDRKWYQQEIETFRNGEALTARRDYRITDKEGKVHWVVENVTRITDSGGRTGVDGTIQDITHRKQAEAQINLLKKAIDNLAESVMITDATSRIQYINRSFEETTGYSSAEIIGNTPRMLQSGVHDDTFYREIWGTLIRKKPWFGKFINRKKDGTLFHEKATISPVLDNTGSISHFIAVKRDITEDLIRDKRIQQSQKMESIGTLAGGIAHDFNNILSPILGFTQLSLQGMERGDILTDNLEEIEKAALRAKDLVAQILTFARHSDENVAPIRIYPIINEALKFIRASIPATIEILTDIRRTEYVTADPTKIHQIVMNLCTNAYHAIDKDTGRIDVVLKDSVLNRPVETPHLTLAPGPYVIFRVSDTGIGISDKDLDVIFEPYFTTKAPGEGTGLGLAVCQGAATTMKGGITVDSTPGKGTTFTLYMPVSRHKSHEPLQDREDIPRGSEHLLFVDDEIPVTKMNKRLLESLGYTVTTKNASLEALEFFSGNPEQFDLVITDMTMPDMAGDQLARRIKALRPDIPVILCSGFNKKITDDVITESGINAYCKKPVSAAEFSRTIRRLLDQGS